MAKKQSKPAVVAPAKKGGDGGRITKPAAKVEQTKSAAKAVVTATKAAGDKLKGILKDSTVCILHRPIFITKKQNKKKSKKEESEESPEEEDDSGSEETSIEDSSEEESDSEEVAPKKAKGAKVAPKADNGSSSEEESSSEVLSLN